MESSRVLPLLAVVLLLTVGACRSNPELAADAAGQGQVGGNATNNGNRAIVPPQIESPYALVSAASTRSVQPRSKPITVVHIYLSPKGDHEVNPLMLAPETAAPNYNGGDVELTYSARGRLHALEIQYESGDVFKATVNNRVMRLVGSGNDQHWADDDWPKVSVFEAADGKTKMIVERGGACMSFILKNSGDILEP